MKCDEAIERLLEADPAELRGRGGTPLAAHVAGCERCGRVAAALLSELEAVEGALAAYAGAVDADAATERALARTEDRPARIEDRPARIEARTSSGPRGSWRRGLGVSVAAAAALAALLLSGRDRQAPIGPDPGPAERNAETIAPRVAVTPPPDRGVAVVETGNPRITIIWLYEREES